MSAPCLTRKARLLKWLGRLLAISLVVLLLAVVLHPPVLRAWARGLVVSRPTDVADAVVIVGGDRAFATAAELWREHRVPRILFFVQPPGRLERLHIVPEPERLARRELLREGADDAAIQALPTPHGDDWECARVLAQWLQEHPGSRLLLLCPEHDGRRYKTICDQVLGPDADRLYWQPLPHRRYDSANWWRCKDGVFAVVNATLSLGHTWWFGETNEANLQWDPDLYEQTLPRNPGR